LGIVEQQIGPPAELDIPLTGLPAFVVEPELVVREEYERFALLDSRQVVLPP
jgi:hypothetical protein